MKLYKETGTNPFSSCLPILAQSPFFFGLYRVLDGIANDHERGVLTPELIESGRNALIFGAPLSDSFLSKTTTLTPYVTVVMIVLMVASQFLTQRQIMMKNMPGGGDNPMAQQQKILLYVFPLVFAVSGVYFPVGVLLYWLTTNLWTMGQQFYVIRRMPAPGSKAEEAFIARKAAKAATKGDPTPTAAAPAAPVVAPAPPRQQPKRQTRTQRKTPPAKTPPAKSPPAKSPPAKTPPAKKPAGGKGQSNGSSAPKAAGSGGSSNGAPPGKGRTSGAGDSSTSGPGSTAGDSSTAGDGSTAGDSST
jgi:YidC/Oxa1 family membrane protein insertase